MQRHTQFTMAKSSMHARRKRWLELDRGHPFLTPDGMDIKIDLLNVLCPFGPTQD